MIDTTNTTVTVDAAARAMRCSAAHVRRLLIQGRLDGYLAGGDWVVVIESVLAGPRGCRPKQAKFRPRSYSGRRSGR